MQPILTRLPKGADLVEAIEAVCRDKGVTKASVQVIGALAKANMGFYLQDEHRYVSHAVDEPVEVLCGLGNVSIKEGEIFCHLHLVLGDAKGAALGGHAMPGCVIFAAEALITPLDGPDLVRAFDEPTGLLLWQGSGG